MTDLISSSPLFLAHRERVWVILYFLKHTGKDFEPFLFCHANTDAVHYYAPLHIRL